MATRERQAKSEAPTPQATKVQPAAESKTEAPKKSKKLSYKLQLELDALPAKLEQLETTIEALQEQINQPDFFSSAVEVTQPILDALQKAESDLETAFMRWEELEAMKNDE